MRDSELSKAILTWYDAHARVLPWRVSPDERRMGIRPDPYRVWLSEIMLQQTTVAAVRTYYLRFTELWPDVAALAAARDSDVMGEWAGLGYYARARNLLKCARRIVAEHGGVFPNDRATLLSLPGIGPYTAAAIAAIVYDRAETVVDGNVERVIARLRGIDVPLPAAKTELNRLAAELTPAARPGDYAQAIMDLGATICTPKSPVCNACPWQQGCTAKQAGTQAQLPRRTQKKPKPIRHGIAYLARRADGAWLLERRPESGLLGGMLGWPTTSWNEKPNADPPIEADWRDLGEEVRHTFTHFHLRLAVRIAEVSVSAIANRGTFHPNAEFRPGRLPTLMRKAYDFASREFVDD